MSLGEQCWNSYPRSGKVPVFHNLLSADRMKRRDLLGQFINWHWKYILTYAKGRVTAEEFLYPSPKTMQRVVVWIAPSLRYKSKIVLSKGPERINLGDLLPTEAERTARIATQCDSGC